MKHRILFLFVYLCVSLFTMAQTALAIYPKEKADSLSIAFRVFGRMAYFEDSLDITHRDGWLLYASSYDDIQHIAFIDYQPTYTSVYDTICSGETYTWNGNISSRPGVYTDTLQNIYGCDSIVELHLEVLPDPALTFTVNGVSFNMMRVRAGSFMMGATENDTEAEADEFPRHEVTLTKDFFIGETEMTQELWTAIMGNNPSADKSNPQSPVNMVLWDDCQQMIAKLNQMTGLTFRLPTEAEWEYAARGGQYSKGYKYAGSDNIDEVAWYNKSYYASVASLKPNELGLYDMSGSVYEWCQDYYKPNFYSSPSHLVDPFQADYVDGRWCLRGGSNEAHQGVNSKKYSRIANRGHSDGTNVSSSNGWGIRLALEATGILEDNSRFITNDTICSGETYTWNGNTYSRPGVYVDTLQNIYGCDSIVELHLEVLPDPALTFTVNGVSFNMMRVRAGSFMMGATPEQGTDALANEKLVHQVTLTRDYFIAETMLTQELWTAVMGTTIQDEEAKRTGGEANLGYGPNYPMYCLSHNDCLNFVKKLNELTGLTFRMPTEAEWEYAARGGHLSKGYKYPGSNDPSEVVWSKANAPDRKLREVKLLKPNELGVYDMGGNVWEYIYDSHRIYTAESQVDPIGDITTNIANIRGGSTAWDAEYSRVSYRHVDSNISKNDKSSRRAFRFVLDADLVIGEDNKNYLQFDTICSGEAYTWNGKKYYYSGTYTDTLQNVYGCDSIVELHLKVHPSYNKYETVVACGSYVFNPFNILGGDTIIRESGVYSDTVTSILGCDSIVTLNLTVMPEAVTTTEKVVIGSNELPYIWRNEEYSESATYSDIEKYASAECDSAIHILDLTVLTTGAVDEQSFAVCECALPYEWYGQTLTTAGKYTHTEKYTGTTIDSVQHILNFIVNKDVTITNTITACDSYTWSDGKTYTESGVYYDSLQTIHGCDSVEVLYLTINNSVLKEYTVTACDSYTWSDGKTYTESGVYYDSLQTVNGCDSVEVLYLTINNSVLKEYTVTECDSYTWTDGNTYTESGVYYDSLQTIHGCDSVEVLYLTINNSVLKEYAVTECDSYTWSDGKTYTESGIYYDSLQTIHGCDSVEVLTLTINNSVLKEYTVTVCDSYTWSDGNTYTESGVYYDSLQTIHGCDSVEVLYLTINNSVLKEYTVTECDSYTWSDGKTYTESGVYYDSLQTVNGCDSVEVLYLTINSSVLKEYTVTECDSYTWSDGKTYTESGVYYDSLQTVNGCDSVEVLYLTINNSVLKEYIVTECDSYTWSDGNTYTESGVYYDSLQTIHGCDSVEVLYLTINNSVVIPYTVTECDSYTWSDGKTYTESGVYYDSLQTIHGCDSIEVLTLIINNSVVVPYTVTECDSYTWTDGKTYTESGVYYDSLQTINGCDSVELLYLTINNSVLKEYTVTECDSYTWTDGNTYTESGVYYDSLQTVHGCDSVEVLYLTINSSVLKEYTVTECDSYTWSDGKTYTESGVYYDSLQTIHGCDSIEVLTLTINNSVVVPYTVTECDSYTWSDGNTYTESGVYYDSLQTVNGCDSVEVLYLTINNSVLKEYTVTECDSYTWSDGKTYTESGVYYDSLQTIHGCDSVEVLYLTINNSIFGKTKSALLAKRKVQ